MDSTVTKEKLTKSVNQTKKNKQKKLVLVGLVQYVLLYFHHLLWYLRLLGV